MSVCYAPGMTPWNKGFKKETHVSVRKVSDTMKARRVDNFKKWRDAHLVQYEEFAHNGDLAELIGAVLGDGNIEKFPRTERLVVVGDAQKPEFVWRYANLIEKLFKKKPVVKKALRSNALRISIYQKFISERLGVPTGNKKHFPHQIPQWIEENDAYIVRFLRGLYEAEGSLSIHLPTCTYNFCFTNLNPYLLKIVDDALTHLEFHTEVRHNAIRIRKRAEVMRLKELIRFRQY